MRYLTTPERIERWLIWGDGPMPILWPEIPDLPEVAEGER